MINKIYCVICKIGKEQNEISQYAAYGGLPSPCCTTCIEVNDYTIKSLNELMIKSLIRHSEDKQKDKS